MVVIYVLRCVCALTTLKKTAPNTLFLLMLSLPQKRRTMSSAMSSTMLLGFFLSTQYLCVLTGEWTGEWKESGQEVGSSDSNDNALVGPDST